MTPVAFDQSKFHHGGRFAMPCSIALDPAARSRSASGVFRRVPVEFPARVAMLTTPKNINRLRARDRA
jgi:hypothetical protein